MKKLIPRKGIAIKIFVPIVLLVLVFGVFAPTNIALAQTNRAKGLPFSLGGASEAAKSFFYDLAGGIFDALREGINATLLPLAGNAIDGVFSFPYFVNAPIVQEGWAISRDIANMAFILIFLFIGFATILRLENYNIKRLLPRLIIIALFINFSLVISGVFIDIGNDIGYWFVSGGQTSGSISGNISQALRLPKALDERTLASQVYTETQNPEGGGVSVETKMLVSDAVRLGITIAVTFLYFAMVLMLVARIVALWVLLILAPLGWIAYAVPGATHLWRKWWQNFLKWSLFPIVFGFFVYLGLLVGIKFGGSGIASVSLSSGNFPGAVPFDTLGLLLQFVAVFILMGIGLLQAQSWSITGSRMAMSWVNKGRGWATGKVRAGTLRGLRLTGGAAKTAVVAPTRGALRLADRYVMPQKRKSFREGLERTPVIGRAVGGPGAAYSKEQSKLSEAIKTLKKSNLRPEDLRNIAKQAVATKDGQRRRAAAVQLLADSGKLKDEDKGFVKDFAAVGGDLRKLIAKMPHWAKDEKIQEDLAQSSSTKEDWGSVAKLPSGSAQRKDAAEKIISEKVIPKKPKDFGQISSSSIDTSETGISPEEHGIRNEMLTLLTKKFRKEELGVRHLNSLPYDNPEMYEKLIEHLNNPTIKITMPESIQRHLDGTPGYASMGPAPAGGETRGGTGGGASEEASETT